MNIENLKVGDTVYTVRETNNAFHRKKIHKEMDGRDWFRYEMPLRSYSISSYTILGILKPSLEGEWPENESFALETEFYVRNNQNDNKFTMSFEYDSKEFFDSEREAVEKMGELELEAKELDLK